MNKKNVTKENLSEYFRQTIRRAIDHGFDLSQKSGFNLENKLGIRIENGEKNSITTYKLNLMDLNEENISIPPAAFESIITLPSSDFQKICRDMSNLSTTIEIKSVGQQLVFGCNGDFASQETIIGQTTNGLAFVKTNDSTDIIQGYYNLKHLVLFTKCVQIYVINLKYI